MEYSNKEPMDTNANQPWPKQEAFLPKRGNASVVWTWFAFKKTQHRNKKRFFTKFCNRPVSTSDSNTTNLFHHEEPWKVIQRETEFTRDSIFAASHQPFPDGTGRRLPEVFSGRYSGICRLWMMAVIWCAEVHRWQAAEGSGTAGTSPRMLCSAGRRA